MSEERSNEYILLVESERKQLAIDDAEFVGDKKKLDIEKRSDEELGSLSYWRTLAETLGKMQGEIDFQQMSGDAQKIYDELHAKGQVKRSEVMKFYNSWNDFVDLNENEEAKRLKDVAAGVYDQPDEEVTDLAA